MYMFFNMSITLGCILLLHLQCLALRHGHPWCFFTLVTIAKRYSPNTYATHTKKFNRDEVITLFYLQKLMDHIHNNSQNNAHRALGVLLNNSSYFSCFDSNFLLFLGVLGALYKVCATVSVFSLQEQSSSK